PAVGEGRLQRRHAGSRPTIVERETVVRLEQVARDDALALVVQIDQVGACHGVILAALPAAQAVAAERASAVSRSATRSSTDSIPTERRTRFAGAANGASEVDACVIA